MIYIYILFVNEKVSMAIEILFLITLERFVDSFRSLSLVVLNNG